MLGCSRLRSSFDELQSVRQLQLQVGVAFGGQTLAQLSTQFRRRQGTQLVAMAVIVVEHVRPGMLQGDL